MPLRPDIGMTRTADRPRFQHCFAGGNAEQASGRARSRPGHFRTDAWPALALDTRRLSLWEDVLRLNALTCKSEQDGLHRVIAQLEQDLSTAARQSLDRFVNALTAPLQAYLHGQSDAPGREQQFASALQQVWDDDFPDFSEAQAARLHVAYDRAARRLGTKMLEAHCGEIGSALLTLLAEKIAGELFLLLVNTDGVTIRDLPQLRRLLHGMALPDDPASSALATPASPAIKLIVAELGDLLRAKTGEAPDFRNQLLREVNFSVRDGAYRLQQLLMEPLPTLRPRRWRDWLAVSLYAQSTLLPDIITDMRAGQSGLAADKADADADADDASLWSRVSAGADALWGGIPSLQALSLPALSLFPGAVAARADARVSGPSLRLQAPGPITHFGPGDTPGNMSRAGAPGSLARHKRAYEDLADFLTADHERDPRLAAIRAIMSQKPEAIPDDFRPATDASFADNNFFQQAWTGAENRIEKARTYQAMRDWHRGSTLADKQQILFDNRRINNIDSLAVDWYDNIPTIPPLHDLMQRVWRDGLDANTVSELITLARFGQELMELDEVGAKTLFYCAYHAYEIYRSGFMARDHAWIETLMLAHADFFIRQPFGYDAFVPFHQYYFSRAGLSFSDCGPTALLYVAAAGDAVKLANLRANLGKAATFAAPMRAFSRQEQPSGQGPFDQTVQLTQADLAKAHFVASGFSQLRPRTLFPEESQFGSPNFVAVRTPEGVGRLLRDLPPGMHLIFQKHDLPDGGAVGHTTVLIVEDHASAPDSFRLFDSNFGELRFPTRTRFVEFIGNAMTPSITPPLFYFPRTRLSAISIVRHANFKLAEKLATLPDLIQRTVPQLLLPFAQIQVVEGYQSGLPSYAGLMTLPPRLALVQADLPVGARAALSARVGAEQQHQITAELESPPCPRSPQAVCTGPVLYFRNGDELIFYRSSDSALIARFTAYRAGRIHAQQIHVLLRSAPANGLEASQFTPAAPPQQAAILLQRDAALSPAIRERIDTYQLARSLPALTGSGSPPPGRPLPALAASGGAAPTRGMLAQHLSTAMARIGMAGGAINSAREIAFLSQPGLPREHPEYARYQIATARAAVDLSAQSAYVAGWGAGRIANLSPAQQSGLALAMGEFIGGADGALARLPLTGPLKAALARNLALASEQIPGAVRFMRGAASAGAGISHVFGTGTAAADALLSAADTALMMNDLHHVTDPDRYEAAEGKLIFSCIETDFKLGIAVSLGSGNLVVAGVLEALNLLLRFARQLYMVGRGTPLENRAGLRAVDLALRQAASDYRNPVSMTVSDSRLTLDFTSVDTGATGVRARLNAVDALDLSTLAQGNIRVQAGRETIALPYVQRMQMPASDLTGVPYWKTYVEPSLHARTRLARLAGAPDWTDVAAPADVSDVTVLLPDAQNDVHVRWHAVSLNDLPDQGLNGPFPSFPLRQPGLHYIAELRPEPLPHPAMLVTAPAGFALTCHVPPGKRTTIALGKNILKLYAQPGSNVKVSGSMSPGSAIVFTDDSAAPAFPLKADAVFWEGSVLRAASARIDLTGVRVDGPVPVMICGAQFVLHPNGDDDTGTTGFPLAGASIRLSHIDASRIRNPDSGQASVPDAFDNSALYGISTSGLMMTLNALHRAAPGLMSLPVHILDRNGTTLFFDAVNFDLFSPQAAGWGAGAYTLMAQKKVWRGTLWLIADTHGAIFSMVRKSNPRPAWKAAYFQNQALPPGTTRTEQNDIVINDRPEHHRLPFDVLKIWQWGDIVKLLSRQFLIYSISAKGTPLLRGAHQNWWKAHFSDFEGVSLTVLRQAFPLQTGWLRLSLPDNGVLHFNPTQNVALLTAAGDDVYPVRYEPASGERPAAMHLHRPNPGGGVDVATVPLGQTAHEMQDFLLGSGGVRAVAGKSATLAHLTASWQAPLPPSNLVLIVPGPDHEGRLAAVSDDFIVRLHRDAARPVASWLLDNLQKAAYDHRVELASAVFINSATRLVFHTGLLTMAVSPQGAVFVAHDDTYAYFYGVSENTLYVKAFQSLAEHHVADFPRLGHLLDVPGTSIALAAFHAQLQEVHIARHSLWVYTQDGRVLEFPPGLNGTHRSEFRPPLVRIAPHWFEENIISPADDSAIESRLTQLMAEHPAYSSRAVLRPDIIAVSLPREGGPEQDGYYFPLKKQYLAPPKAMRHGTSAADVSTTLRPAYLSVPVPGGLWKGAHASEDGENWYYLVRNGERVILGKLQLIEAFGKNGDRSLLIIPADDAVQIDLPLLDQAVQRYLIQRGPGTSSLCAFYLRCSTLPVNQLDIWIKGNGAGARAQQYLLVVSADLSLTPGSLQTATDANGQRIYSAELRDAGQRTLQLRFTALGPHDQVMVARGLTSQDRQNLILIQGDDD